MKIPLKWTGLTCFVLAVGMLAGCQQANSPMTASPSQMGASGTGGADSATATPDVKASSLLGCLLCPPPTPTPMPNVGMTQSCSPGTVSAGGSVTYTVQLSVTGGAASNVVVQDVLPAGMSYVQGTATSLAGGTFTCTGSTLTWVYNTVGPCTCTMTYVAQLAGTAANLAGSVLANTSTLACTGLSAALSATANLLVSASAALTPPPTNTFTSTPVPPTATNTFTPTNTFTATATPTNSFTPTNTFTSTNTATATHTPTSTFTPTRTFTPTNTGTPTNTFTVTDTPTPIVNLTQTCSALSAALGGAVTFTLNLAVSGCAAGNVVIQDVLPAGMSYVQGTATTLSGGAFTCTGSTLKWVYNSVGPCNCTMTYVAQVNNLVSLVGSTLTNSAVMTCPSLTSSATASANLLVTGLLGLGL